MLTLFLIGSSTSCANNAPAPPPRHTVETVTQVRYVRIPEEATDPVEVVKLPPGPVGPYGMRAALQACQVRTEECNGKLEGIGKVEGTEVPGTSPPQQ